MNPFEAERLIRKLAKNLEQALSQLEEQAKRAAFAEAEYRRAKAEAWAQVAAQDEKKLAPHRQAEVDAACSDKRLERDLAEALKLSWLERVRALRQELSAVQTLLNAYKEEASVGISDTP